MPDTLKIRFPDVSLAEANRLSESLEEAIRYAAPTTKVERQRDDPTTQDFGATLAVLLGGPAVVAIAKGIEVWLQKYRDVELEISTSDGVRVVAKRITVNTAGKVIAEVMAATRRTNS